MRLDDLDDTLLRDSLAVIAIGAVAVGAYMLNQFANHRANMRAQPNPERGRSLIETDYEARTRYVVGRSQMPAVEIRHRAAPGLHPCGRND